MICPRPLPSSHPQNRNTLIHMHTPIHSHTHLHIFAHTYTYRYSISQAQPQAQSDPTLVFFCLSPPGFPKAICSSLSSMFLYHPLFLCHSSLCFSDPYFFCLCLSSFSSLYSPSIINFLLCLPLYCPCSSASLPLCSHFSLISFPSAFTFSVFMSVSVDAHTLSIFSYSNQNIR